MKLFKKKSNPNDDFLAQEAKEEAATAADYTLDIPDDEIWSYQIEGLQAPAINKSYKKATGKKLLVIVVLLIAISCSIFLSVRAVHRDEFGYKQLDDSSYQLTKYSNPGEVTEVTVDYVDGDKSKPVSTIYEYAFNCDEKLTQITIGKDVKSIDAKAIYSCWALQNIYVDDDNPYYCDLDGVLYNKDKTEIILYPIDHDRYLRLQTGYAYKDKNGVQHSKMVDDSGAEMEDLWGTTNKYDEKYLEKYPSIEVTIDVHRDSITYSNKTKVKPTAKINGKKAARMMIISGCEYGRVENFPDWEDNLRFDLAVQQKMASSYKGLMRPILFSERKYNMYETHSSFLLEIGSDGNTLDEACYSARLFGKALGELLNEKYVVK